MVVSLSWGALSNWMAYAVNWTDICYLDIILIIIHSVSMWTINFIKLETRIRFLKLDLGIHKFPSEI